MARLKRKARSFHDGLTTIHMEFSHPNQCWFVWRDDSGHVGKGMLTKHDTLEEASEEFDRKCKFLESLDWPGDSKGAQELQARVRQRKEGKHGR